MNRSGWVRTRQTVAYALIGALALLMLYPLLWMISSSLKPNDLIFADQRLLPSTVTASNYLEGWRGVSGFTFARFYRNTLVVVSFSVIGVLASSSLTAFAFARLRFPLRRTMFVLMMLTIMVPPHAVLIPQYTLFLKLGWVDSFLPLIVPKFFATGAFFVFLIVQFVRGIPHELDEAAIIDGCSQFGLYARVILPLTIPAMGTAFIFAFVWNYNDFLAQLIYLSDPSKLTISIALRFFLDATARSNYGQLFAMSTVSLVPIVVLFVVFQRLLIEGISTSGLKG